MEIILLHGALGSGRQLVPLMEILMQNKLKVHAINFPAHGFSRKESFSIAELSQFVEQYIKKNIHGDYSIFGFSMGGYVALHLATWLKPRAVITLGTRINWTPEVAEKDSRRLYADKIREKVPAFARQLEELHGADWGDLLLHTAAMIRSLGAYPLLSPDTFKKIESEVLMMVGGADNMITWDETIAAASHIPNGRGEVLPGVVHPIEQVDPGLIAGKIMDFCHIPQKA